MLQQEINSQDKLKQIEEDRQEVNCDHPAAPATPSSPALPDKPNSVTASNT